MKTKFFEKLRDYTYFIWLILLIFIAVFVTYFYDTNKKRQIYHLQKSFYNIYLKKTIETLTSELTPRYIEINYKVQSGDTYENIIDAIDMPKEEKKLFLDNVKKNKEVKSLIQNQKIFFILDFFAAINAYSQDGKPFIFIVFFPGKPMLLFLPITSAATFFDLF